jgi:hypothetical protein
MCTGQRWRALAKVRFNGNRPPKDIGTKSEPISEPPMLAEIGLTKKESVLAQKLAALPAEGEVRLR